MNIDQFVMPGIDETGTQKAHKPGETDKFDAVSTEGGVDFGVERLTPVKRPMIDDRR